MRVPLRIGSAVRDNIRPKADAANSDFGCNARKMESVVDAPVDALLIVDAPLIVHSVVDALFVIAGRPCALPGINPLPEIK